MEVLAGARTDVHENDLRRLVLRFTWLPVDPVTDIDSAARIYRRCRQSGITPRGLVDCLIAAVAWRSNAALLAHDAALYRVADVVVISLDLASHRP